MAGMESRSGRMPETDLACELTVALSKQWYHDWAQGNNRVNVLDWMNSAGGVPLSMLDPS